VSSIGRGSGVGRRWRSVRRCSEAPAASNFYRSEWGRNLGVAGVSVGVQRHMYSVLRFAPAVDVQHSERRVLEILQNKKEARRTIPIQNGDYLPSAVGARSCENICSIPSMYSGV